MKNKKSNLLVANPGIWIGLVVVAFTFMVMVLLETGTVIPQNGNTMAEFKMTLKE